MASEDLKKKAGSLIAIAFGKPHQGMPPDSGDEDESDEDEGVSAAADEVFDALKSGDRKAFASSLKAFVSMCDSYEDEEEEK